MKIIFGGHDFFLHYSGALYWPEENMLIVSDLHLEKGSHFARRGFFLPPYDSHDTLTTLMKVLKETSARKLLLLGDAFHDANGFERLGKKERFLFADLLAFNPIWIHGNHDAGFVPDGFMGMEDYAHRGLSFRHQASPGATNEISGHFHPKAEMQFGRGRHSCPCFIEDGQRMILPAFGSYTGGLPVTEAIIAELFVNPKLYLLGEKRVYAIEYSNEDKLASPPVRDADWNYI